MANNIPNIDGSITDDKTTDEEQVDIIPARDLINKKLMITKVMLNHPSRYNRCDLYFFTSDKNISCGFFNNNIKRQGVKPGDVIVLKLTRNKHGTICYIADKVDQTKKQTPQNQPPSPPQPHPPQNLETVLTFVKTASSKDAVVAYFEKYGKMSKQEAAETADGLWSTYHPDVK